MAEEEEEGRNYVRSCKADLSFYLVSNIASIVFNVVWQAEQKIAIGNHVEEIPVAEVLISNMNSTNLALFKYGERL